MNKLNLIGICGSALLTFLPFNQQEENAPPPPDHAVAVLQPTSGHEVSGTVEFMQQGEDLKITGEVSGLSPGKHGFHVHQYGDLRSKDGSSAGEHFDPYNNPHAGLNEAERHVGDFGNITANEQGVANVDITAGGVKLHFLIGRAVVVHASEDDLQSQPSGDAGDRVGLGVIGIAKSIGQQQTGAANAD